MSEEGARRERVETPSVVRLPHTHTSPTNPPPFCCSFRYLSVTGLSGVPTLTAGLVMGLHFHSATPAVGSLAFPASANTLNQLQHAIVWTQASNILGNPSDCPQRDEVS